MTDLLFIIVFIFSKVYILYWILFCIWILYIYIFNADSKCFLFCFVHAMEVTLVDVVVVALIHRTRTHTPQNLSPIKSHKQLSQSFSSQTGPGMFRRQKDCNRDDNSFLRVRSVGCQWKGFSPACL